MFKISGQEMKLIDNRNSETMKQKDVISLLLVDLKRPDYRGYIVSLRQHPTSLSASSLRHLRSLDILSHGLCQLWLRLVLTLFRYCPSLWNRFQPSTRA